MEELTALAASLAGESLMGGDFGGLGGLESLRSRSWSRREVAC